MGFCLGMIGPITLAIGLYVRAGGFKAMYLVKGTPLIVPRAIRHMFIPLGLTFTLQGLLVSDLIADQETRLNLFIWLIMPMMGISIVLGMWHPRWLQPRWLVYLEDTYGPIIIWLLLEDAANDVPAWSKQVATQAGLEAWAEETFIKLGSPRVVKK